MCACGGNRKVTTKAAIPNNTVGTNQILVQQSAQQQDRERTFQKQIMAKNRPIIKR